MISISDLSAHDLMSIAPRIVGATFLWSAGIKAAAPHTFSRHLRALGWFRRKHLHHAVTAAAALEAGLGAALIVNAAPGVLLPFTFVLLFVLAGVAVWGVRSGKTTDCGCYGGFIQPSIGQSVGLNALFAALVAVGWVGQRDVVSATLWQAVVVAMAAMAAAALAHQAQVFARKHGRLMINTTPLKPGRRWKHSSAGGATSGIDGEVLVSYLGPECPHCGRWVKVLNAMHQGAGLPSVVGVMTATGEARTAYIAEKGIRFPVATVSQTVMGRLTQAVPTTVRIEHGRIQEVWAGVGPPEFADRFRRAFFPDSLVESLLEKSG